ncbi:hypothetical protein [Sulfurimonas sp.]
MMSIFNKIKNELSLNSLKLFALFIDDEREFRATNSVLHLNVVNQKETSDLETATITHMPFSEINQYISKTIMQNTKKLSMIVYFTVLFIVTILLYNFFDLYGVIVSLLLVEKHIQHMLLVKINDYILSKVKNKFLNDLNLHLTTYG